MSILCKENSTVERKRAREKVRRIAKVRSLKKEGNKQTDLVKFALGRENSNVMIVRS
jgi:hypothetical protein